MRVDAQGSSTAHDFRTRHRVRVRFYQELGDFLAPHRRGREFELTVHDGTTTKALVEHCGVPHGEVDLLLVDGESVDFACKLQDGQRVSVYPVFESFDISSLTRVRPVPLRVVRFLVDANLASWPRCCACAASTPPTPQCCTERRAAPRRTAPRRAAPRRACPALTRLAESAGHAVLTTHTSLTKYGAPTVRMLPTRWHALTRRATPRETGTLAAPFHPPAQTTRMPAWWRRRGASSASS